MLAIIITVITLIICMILSAFGSWLCLKNNTLGLILLFFGLNIIGLMIGFLILENNKNNQSYNIKDFQEVEVMQK